MASSTTTARNNGQAIAAHGAAVRKLIANYSEEFGELLREERVSRGLSPVAGGDSTKELEERLRKAEERTAKIREALAARGASVE